MYYKNILFICLISISRFDKNYWYQFFDDLDFSKFFSLQFLTGDNKNITFSPGNGASVWIGEEDIVQTLNDYRQLEARVGTIDSKLQTDNCRSSPCQNGGKCVSLYEGYHCECPKEKFFLLRNSMFKKTLRLFGKIRKKSEIFFLLLDRESHYL